MRVSVLTLIVTLLGGVLVSADESTGDGQSSKATTTLPVQVDLRPQFIEYGLQPRSQGERNTCSVFTTTSAIEFALSKKLNKGTPLSVEYLNWACNRVIRNRTQDRGQFFHDLLKGFDQYGLCPEADMPYQAKFDPSLRPSEELRDAAKQILTKDLKVHWINPWKKEPGLTDEQFQQIREVLTKGYPVAAGSSHSRLLVGYFDDPVQAGGGTFITKDSGTGRFDKVTYEFVKTKVGDVFWVEAATENSNQGSQATP